MNHFSRDKTTSRIDNPSQINIGCKICMHSFENKYIKKIISSDIFYQWKIYSNDHKQLKFYKIIFFFFSTEIIDDFLLFPIDETISNLCFSKKKNKSTFYQSIKWKSYRHRFDLMINIFESDQNQLTLDCSCITIEIEVIKISYSRRQDQEHHVSI
jgi:hypothetical protein